MDSVYTSILADFDARFGASTYRAPYQHRNPHPDQITNEVDVAAEMWCFFPTHFFMFRQMLAEQLLSFPTDRLTDSIIGSAQLTILDIGSGVGTATLATIDLLHEWQQCLLAAGYAPARIRLTVQPVERNQLKVPVLGRVLAYARDRLSPFLVQLEVLPTVTSPYPDDRCLEEIRGALQTGGPHLLVTFSNILTWIRAWRPAPRNWFHKVGMWLRSFVVSDPMPPYLLGTIALLNSLPFDRKTTVFVETDDRAGRLASDVQAAVKALASQVEGVDTTLADAGRVTFVNPPGSAYHARGYRESPTVVYHRGFCLALAPAFRRQQRLREALSRNNLRLAWAKARHWEHTMFITDEVGQKLFEADLSWKLERFRHLAFAGRVQDDCRPLLLRYGAPKTADSERPMSACSLEDQMLCIALIWEHLGQFEDHFDRHGVTSFAYRLNEQADEFLYRHWFRCHRRFVGAVCQALTRWKGGYLQGDLSRCFDSFDQRTLVERLREYLDPAETVMGKIWENHIIQECWSGKELGYGIFQGHAASGLLANVYLASVDRDMTMGHGHADGRYFRYVDDMVWVYAHGSRPDTLPAAIVASLAARHDLSLNAEKARGGTADDFMRAVNDPAIQDLAELCRTVIRPLYRLGWNQLRLLWREKSAFSQLYAQALHQIGVHTSPWYLLRKFQREGAFSAWAARIFRPTGRLTIPPLPDRDNPDLLASWAKEFEKRNAGWWSAKNRLANTLVKFAWGAWTALENQPRTSEERRPLLRRLRFVAFRLATFAHADAPRLFREFFDKPWLVPSHVTARALRYYGCGAILHSGLSSPTLLVRVKAAQELGQLRYEAARATLWHMASASTMPIERLAATEGLLRLRAFSGDDQAILVRLLEQEDHPLVLKNLIMMLPHASIAGWQTVAEQAVRRCPHQVVIDSYAWVMSHPRDHLLAQPDVEPPFTRKTEYPDFEFYSAYGQESE